MHSASQGGSRPPTSKQIQPGEQGRAEPKVSYSLGTWAENGSGGEEGLETSPLTPNFQL